MSRLVNGNVQQLISEEYYGGKDTMELSEEELKPGLYRLARTEGQPIGIQRFKAGMIRVLKMDPETRVPAEYSL